MLHIRTDFGKLNFRTFTFFRQPGIILTLCLCLGVNSLSGQSLFKYRLDLPDVQRQLPVILNEVSGLTDIDMSQVACVQDEIGTVFIYNFRSGEITSQHVFDSIGDFEGLTYTGKALYILRSDGRLSEWDQFNSGKAAFRHYKLPLSTSDNEGLCYDAGFNRLLIAAKSKPRDHDAKTARLIYSFDLSKKQLQEKPVYSLNTDVLAAAAAKYGIANRETNAKGELKPFNFRPSSLAVHPVTDHIYIISAADRLLLVINRKGDVLHMEPLNPDRFAKAEGITFLHDGTMIITNEAAGKTPTLLLYHMQAD